MIKALLRKQISAFKYSLFQDKKTGKTRKGGAVTGLAILLIISYLSIMFLFFGMASQMVSPLYVSGMGYLPFAFLGVIAFMISVFTTGFYAGSTLYGAKDNELLFSMPIPPLKILFVRMISVYLISILSTSIVLVPTVAAYAIFARPTVLSLVFGILNIFIFPVFSTVCSCALGFVISVITAKVRRKSFVTAALTVTFLVVYYVFYFNMQKIIASVIKNGEKFAGRIKRFGHFFYLFGQASAGEYKEMLLFILINALLVVALYFVLTKTFIKVATGEKSAKKMHKSRERQKNAIKVQSIKTALLKRELRRFVSSTAYLTNVGLGIVLMIAAAVCLAIFKGKINSALNSITVNLPIEVAAIVSDLIRAAVAIMICILSSTVYFSAASVSTEGNKLWILSTAPIGAKRIFEAKINAHLLLCGIPAAILSVVSSFVLGFDIKSALVQLLFCEGYIWVSAVLGLYFNIKMPNFNWTNETVPVKQGAPVLIVFFGGWFLSILIAAGAYFSRPFLATDLYLLFFGIVFIAVGSIVNANISKNGEKMFLNLV